MNSSPTRRHIPELDGVRGIAVLLVLIFHFMHNPALPVAVDNVVRAGWIGVDLFFVLSGFLITGILLNTKQSPDYFRRFYRNRALRIFPLYYAYVAGAFLLLSVPVLKQLPYWTFFGNVALGSDNQVRYLEHFWSLAIEEQFYLLWPLVVLRVSSRRLTWLCVSGIAVILPVRFVAAHFHWPANFIYSSTPLRCDALLMGALVACLHQRQLLALIARYLKWTALIGAALFMLGSVMTGTPSQLSPAIERFGYFGIDLLSASGIAAVVLRVGSGGTVKALRHDFLTFFGRYSYGLYVLHFPLIAMLSPWFAARFAPVPAACLVLLSGTALSCVAALISAKVLEGPFLSLKEKRPAKERVMAAY